MVKKAKAKKDKKGGKFFLGAAIGAIAGGIAGVLTAPKSGKETQADIKKGGERLAKKAKSAVKKAGAKPAAKKPATKKAVAKKPAAKKSARKK